MQTEAPNFTGSYPLAGERIGPAWRDAWTMLQVDEWINGGDIAAKVAPRYGLAPQTVVNLLRSARYYGILSVQLRRPHGRSKASGHYRVRQSVVIPTEKD